MRCTHNFIEGLVLSEVFFFFFFFFKGVFLNFKFLFFFF